MLEQIKYVNHLGEVLQFGDWEGLFVNAHELYDFDWKVVSVNDRISGFERGIQERTIPVRILCANGREGLALRNKLFEIPEKDVLAGVYGRLWINGYYCDCYVHSSTKDFYSQNGKYYECKIEISTDKPYWVKETTTYFTGTDVDGEGSDDDEPVVSEYLDYAYDFPHDYMVNTYRKNELDNEGFYDSKFRMVINGAIVNPTIYINGHMYQVNTTVASGETLTIDSSAQTIYLTRSDGEVVNVFDTRNRDSYIFQPIPAGKQQILWDNTFDFSVVLLEERSEPKWVWGYVTEDWSYELNAGHVLETSPINESSGYTFAIKGGRLMLNQDDLAMDNLDFKLRQGRLIVTYG